VVAYCLNTQKTDVMTDKLEAYKPASLSLFEQSLIIGEGLICKNQPRPIVCFHYYYFFLIDFQQNSKEFLQLT